MTIAIILVVFAFVALIFLIRLTKGAALPAQAIENPASYLQPVDVSAFRNLIDPEEEQYLRRSLPTHDYRKIQRERMHSAIEYISAAAQNAAILLRLGELARRSTDPATAAAADRLVENAIRLRLYAFQAMPRLYIAMLVPATRISSLRVVDSYEHMTRQVILLGIRYPSAAVSSAL